MDDFYEIAELCHEDRVRRYEQETNSPEYKAKIEYTMFEIWCRLNKKENNEKNFKEYAKDKPCLDFWLKKLIFEMFFNYKFTFNYDTKKWKAEKIK